MQPFIRTLVGLLVLNGVVHITNTIAFRLVYNFIMGVLELHLRIGDAVLESQRHQYHPLFKGLGFRICYSSSLDILFSSIWLA
jgi:hypothetical protein